MTGGRDPWADHDDFLGSDGSKFRPPGIQKRALYQTVLTLTHRQRPNAVMPTQVGIHDFAVQVTRKAWMLTCVSMTGNDDRYVIHFTGCS